MAEAAARHARLSRGRFGICSRYPSGTRTRINDAEQVAQMHVAPHLPGEDGKLEIQHAQHMFGLAIITSVVLVAVLFF